MRHIHHQDESGSRFRAKRESCSWLIIYPQLEMAMPCSLMDVKRNLATERFGMCVIYQKGLRHKKNYRSTQSPIPRIALILLPTRSQTTALLLFYSKYSCYVRRYGSIIKIINTPATLNINFWCIYFCYEEYYA